MAVVDIVEGDVTTGALRVSSWQEPEARSPSSDRQPAGQHTPRSHLLIKRQKSLLQGNSYEVREPLRLPNGTIKGNRLFAAVHHCTKVKPSFNESYKIYSGVDLRIGHSESDLIGKLKSTENCSAYMLYGGDATGVQFGDSDRHGRPRVATIRFQATRRPSWSPSAMVVRVDDSDEVGVEHVLQTKEAFYDRKARKWKSDYGGRQFDSSVVLPSTKNHQLEHEGEIVFQLIKVESDLFSLEYKWPLSGAQAVGIAMSRFGRVNTSSSAVG